MIEKNQLKVQGLAFGRSFQTAFKNAVMYSLDHPAIEKPIQQSFTSLNNLVKQTHQFTFGFANRRVLVNNILTEDDFLRQLEVEFDKRRIAAITFSAGITLRDFKRTLALLGTKPQAIEESGGIKSFLKQNPIDGVRILPATKSGTEDAEVEMDAESFLMAREILGAQSGASAGGLELLCQLAGVEKPPGCATSAGEILELASQATQAVLADPKGDPSGLLATLACTLGKLTPDSLLSTLPPSRQSSLRGRPTNDVATDLFEHMVVAGTVKKLANSPAGAEAIAVEAEVAGSLFRALKATRMAESLLQKLAILLKEAGLPPDVYDRLRQGMVWHALSPKEKHAQLMSLERFGLQDFERLVGYVKELVDEGKIEEAIEVADHYFSFLDSSSSEPPVQELARAPELLRVMAGLQTRQFLRKMTERLCQELLGETRQSAEWHKQVAKFLISAAQVAAPYEDFELVHELGLNLERSLARCWAEHSGCCGKALEDLLTPASAQRLVELYIERHDDSTWTRTVGRLLQWLGPTGSETVFQRLEDETAAPNRIRLLRLLTQLGPAGLEAARRRLTDERWYVVRNACRILGDLGDPELSNHLCGPLRHSDPRVQQSAITALINSQGADRARVIAESLPHLQGPVQELALDELMLLKDATSIDGLEQFIFTAKESKVFTLEKAVRALASIPSERAIAALGKVLSENQLPISAHKVGLEALSRSPFAISQQLLNRLSSSFPSEGPPAAM